jgi:hypothetical protein
MFPSGFHRRSESVVGLAKGLFRGCLFDESACKIEVVRDHNLNCIVCQRTLAL